MDSMVSRTIIIVGVINIALIALLVFLKPVLRKKIQEPSTVKIDSLQAIINERDGVIVAQLELLKAQQFKIDSITIIVEANKKEVIKILDKNKKLNEEYKNAMDKFDTLVFNNDINALDSLREKHFPGSR